MSTGRGHRGRCGRSDGPPATSRRTRYDGGVLARLTRPTYRRGAARLALVLALAASAIVAPGVRAEDVLRLGGVVTDTTGLLADDTAAIEEASQAVLDAYGVQTFVVFVADTGGRQMPDYAFETASANSLGVNDALLVVAIDDRTDFIWVADGLASITDDELDEIIGGTLEPALADGEFGRAVTETIEALGDAADSAAPTDGPLVPGPATAAPIPGPEPGTGDPDGGGGIGLGTVVAIALIGGGAFLLFRRRRGTSGTAAAVPADAAPAELSGPALAQRATALLIATDERIRDAQQEDGLRRGPVRPPRGRAAACGGRDGAGGAPRGLQGPPATRRRRPRKTRPPGTRCCARSSSGPRAPRRRSIARRTGSGSFATWSAMRRTRSSSCPGGSRPSRSACPRRARRSPDSQRYAPTTWQPVAGNLEEAQKGLDGARDAVDPGQRPP